MCVRVWLITHGLDLLPPTMAASVARAKPAAGLVLYRACAAVAGDVEVLLGRRNRNHKLVLLFRWT